MSERETKRRRVLTLKEKKEICQYAIDNPGLKHNELAKKFKIGRSTVTEILEKSKKFLTIDENSSLALQKRERSH